MKASARPFLCLLLIHCGGAKEDSETDSETGGEPVVAPVVRTYRPLNSAEVEHVQDPSPELDVLEIFAEGSTIPGMFDGDSTIEFMSVPAGTYQLHYRYSTPADDPSAVRPDQIFETDVRTFGRFEAIYAGRQNVASTETSGTSLAISATPAPQALSYNDLFEVYSYNADVLTFYFADDGQNAPLFPGTIDNWIVDWQPGGANGYALVDSSAGDDLWLSYYRWSQLVPVPSGDEVNDPWSYAHVYTLSAAAPMSFPPMVEGATNPITGEFVEVPTVTTPLDIRGSSFLSVLQASIVEPEDMICRVYVFLEPGEEHPIIGVTPYLTRIFALSIPDVNPVFPGDHVVDVQSTHPYPSGGTVTGYAGCEVSKIVAIPETTAEVELESASYVLNRLSVMSQAPVTPKLSPPANLRVNGNLLPPVATREDVGLAPTISFLPPELGSPDYYQIRLAAVEVNAGIAEPVTTLVWQTTQTSVTLPEWAMRPGLYHYVTVTANAGLPLHRIYGDTHDVQTASAVTGLFRP